MSKKTKYKSLHELIPQTQQIPWQDERDKNVAEKVQSKKINSKPFTLNHNKYIELIEKSIYTFAIGYAGCGKSGIACQIAAKYLIENKVDKIIITRPLVQCDEELGILPGDMMEKVSPYLSPITEFFKTYLTAEKLDLYIKKEIIEVCPLAIMRGRTFHNTFIIADEMQNATVNQIRMLLTRLGHNSKMVINGDTEQSDLGLNYSPLIDVIDTVIEEKRSEISLIEFTRNDCLRPDIIQYIDKKINNYLKKSKGQFDKDEKLGYNVSSTQKVLHTETESWYQEKCKYCKKVCWANNGDEQNPDLEDYEAFECWNCHKNNIIHDCDNPYKVISYAKPRI